MTKILIKSTCTLLLLAGSLLSYAQEEAPEAVEGMKGAHRLTLGLGHTHVSKGVVNGENQWLTLPSWAFDYDYWLSNRWAIGLETDIVTESFSVEEEDGKDIERSFPISVVPVGIYKAMEHLNVVGGVGAEFAEEDNLLLTRLGLELGFELPREWEVGATLLWDNKWEYYNSWSLAFTVSKVWKGKK